MGALASLKRSRAGGGTEGSSDGCFEDEDPIVVRQFSLETCLLRKYRETEWTLPTFF